MDKKVSEKSTKKELLDAYQKLLHGQQEVAQPENRDDSGQDSPEQPPQPQAVTSRTSLSSAPILQDIDTLRHSVGEILERFGEQVTSFEKRACEEEERLTSETQGKRTEWKREQELYEYERGMKRRREDDEYTLKIADRERQFNERFVVKEQDFGEREERIKTAEEEIKQLRMQVERFPKELEQTTTKAVSEARASALAEANAAKTLAAKDTEREQEIAKLKIQGLEDTIKRQQTQIVTLERELSRAYEQIQKLAVTVIESRAVAPRTEEYHHAPASPQEPSQERRKNP